MVIQSWEFENSLFKFRLVNEFALRSIDNWTKIEHANIVSAKEAFTTKAFGDTCIINFCVNY